MVVLYTKDKCPQCKFTKRKLNELNVDFKEINVIKDAEALAHIKSLGYESVPVVELGATHFDGYRPTELTLISQQLAV